MNDPFEKKVSTAAVAAWWVFLIGYAMLIVAGSAYLVVVTNRPAWFIWLWGQDVTWDFVQTVALWFFAAFKLSLWYVFLAAAWLTLWARQLRKKASSNEHPHDRKSRSAAERELQAK